METLAKIRAPSLATCACLAVLLGGCSGHSFQPPWSSTGVAAPTTLTSGPASNDPTVTSALASTGNLAAPAGAPTPTADTTSGRLSHIAWNTAWAQACGFYFDDAKLKAAYLAFEARSGLPADQMDKVSGYYDRGQAGFRKLAAGHPDQCTPNRLALIQATIARYLAGDFSPGQAV